VTGSEKAGVELIDILGNNRGDDNRVNREETVNLANKATVRTWKVDLVSSVRPYHATRPTEKHRNNHGLTDQTAPNLLDLIQAITQVGDDPRTLCVIKDRTLDSIFSC
jgi:hypothetical protein